MTAWCKKTSGMPGTKCRLKAGSSLYSEWLPGIRPATHEPYSSRRRFFQLIHSATGIREPLAFFNEGLIDDGAEIGAVGAVTGVLHAGDDITDGHRFAGFGEHFGHGGDEALAV